MTAHNITSNDGAVNLTINGLNIFASREGLACVSALIYRELGNESSVEAKRALLAKYDAKVSPPGMRYLSDLVQAGYDMCMIAIENVGGNAAKLAEIQKVIQAVWPAEYVHPEMDKKNMVAIEVEGEEGLRVSLGRFPELARLERSIQGEYDASYNRGIKRAKDVGAFEADLQARRRARLNGEFLPQLDVELRKAASALGDLAQGIAGFIDANVFRYQEIQIKGYVGVEEMLSLHELRPSMLMSKRQARRVAQRSRNKETGLLSGMVRSRDVSGISEFSRRMTGGGFAGANA